jgi:hypothetical protein
VETPVAADPTPPQPAPPQPALTIVTVWLNPGGRRRLLDAVSAELTDNLDLVGEANLVVVSTRTPPFRNPATLPIWDAPEKVVVSCHLGGEPLAAQLVELGARLVVAEGNEGAIGRWLEGSSEDLLVSEFSARAENSREVGVDHISKDDATGLPAASAFELRLAELGREGLIPRLAIIDLPDLGSHRRNLGQSGLDVLRRRLANALSEQARHAGAALFTLSERRIASLGVDQSRPKIERMAHAMMGLISLHSPGGESLNGSIGLAGPEMAGDVASLRQLAERAAEAARIAPETRIVDAEKLTETSAATVELDAALGLVDAVEASDPNGPGHSQRVVDFATEIGRKMGLAGEELIRVGLAARLHAIGTLSLPVQARQAAADDPIYQEHAVRAADYLRVSAGPDVAAAVRGHHERWDGTGFPDGLAGEEIPLGARILAVADTYDIWSHEPGGSDMATVLGRLEENSGTQFDGAVVAAARALAGRG